eukprot:6261786-Amphidinium_carterae.1
MGYGLAMQKIKGQWTEATREGSPDSNHMKQVRVLRLKTCDVHRVTQIIITAMQLSLPSQRVQLKPRA